MVVLLVCGLLLAVPLVLCIVWRRARFVEPTLPAPADGAQPSGVRRRLDGLRIYAWWASMLLLVGTVSGVLVVGAGGRLAMRLLAVTSPEAFGRLTEAQATVGIISVQGSIAFLIFAGLPFGFSSSLLYLFVRPWLPSGWLGGPAFGLVALIVIAPFEDPLRADNLDFDLVGPGWLSVLVFAALALVQGTFLAAFAGRMSRSLPLMSRANWPAAILPLLLGLLLFPIGAVLALGALVAFLAPRVLPWVLMVRASKTGVLIGRVLMVVAVLAAMPAFVASVVAISQR